jgi:hypothetical protein
MRKNSSIEREAAADWQRFDRNRQQQYDDLMKGNSFGQRRGLVRDDDDRKLMTITTEGASDRAKPRQEGTPRRGGDHPTLALAPESKKHSLFGS